MNNFYNLLLYFIIYSVLGWCAEVVFAAIRHGKFVNRGMLKGPYCPIYGFGMITVIICLSPFTDSWLLLFVLSAVLTSLLELITGFVLDKIFHQKWWDYSNMRFNIGGYICPLFSLLWGAACVLIMKLVQPFFAFLCRLIPLPVGIIIIVIFYICIIADAALTIPEIAALRKDLKLIALLEDSLCTVSDTVGSDLSKAAVKTAEAVKHSQERMEKNKKQREKNLADIRKRLEKIAQQRNTHISDIFDKSNAQKAKLLSEHTKERYRRLLTAFPALKNPFGSNENNDDEK